MSMNPALPPPPSLGTGAGHPPQEVACCMCRRVVPAATAYTPYAGCSVCGECIPAYRRMYPRQFMMPFFRERNLLAIAKESRLPNRCVACGAPGAHRKLKQFSWHEPWIILTIFAGLLVYIILMILLSKKGRLEYALCDAHQDKLIRDGRIAAFLGLVVPLLLVGVWHFFGARLSPSTGALMLLGGTVSLFAGLFWGAASHQVLKVRKIDDRYIYLGGLPPELEAELHALAAQTPIMQPWTAPALGVPVVPAASVPPQPPRMH